tara:strand:+ start:891 stop:3443 length:2553 start_codon:yes stop_codon:yes gene_type:complete
MVVVTSMITLGASFAAGAVGSALGLSAITGGFAAFALGLGINVLMGAALRALSPKPSAGSNRGYMTTAIGTALDHQIVYGKVRVAGARIYDEATGVNNKYLHRVLAVAGHEIESFDELYVNDELVTLDVDGEVITPTKYAGKIRFKLHLGSPTQTADTFLVSESTHWTSQCTLSNIAYMYIRLKFDADVFPNGIPEFTATIRGKKVYDPRTTTTSYSDNPALCMRDYLTSPYGLAEVAANIDDVMVVSAANVCDQTNTDAGTTRYTCNGSFTLSATPYEAINSMLTSMDASLWYAQGKWRMKPAYWTAPVLDLNEDDLRSSISISTRHSRRDNFNTVKGTFRGSESNWQVTDYPQVPQNTAANPNPFMEVDGGQESVADIELPFTDNSIEARRIALISLERNRQQLTVSASFGLKTLQLQVGDNIRLTNTRFGWTNKEFEVVSWNFGLTDGLDLQTEMTLRETAESVYDEVSDGVVYERDNTTLLSPFEVPLLGMSAVPKTQVIREKLTNIITLTTSSGATSVIDHVEAEFKLSSDAVWINLGSGEVGDFKAVDLEDGNYDFRARAINTFAIKGEWSYLNNVNASGLLQPPSNVDGFVAEVNGSVISLDWNAVPDLDLSFYRIRYSPDLINASWANSITYVDKVSRPASSVSVPARAGTYLVKAFDKSGISSVNYTSTVVPLADIEPLVNTLTLTDSPAFTGSKTNVEVVSSKLRITNYTTSPSEGDYLFSSYIETGDNTIKRCRVYISAVNNRFDNTAGLFDDQPNLFDDAAGLFDDLGGGSQFADTNIITQVSTTQDDPAGTPTWSDYALIKVADISARAFRFKVILESSANNISPSISELTAYVEYN